LITNLFGLRQCAVQSFQVRQPFRVVAQVVEADPQAGSVVLKDASTLEFIHLDLSHTSVQPGDVVCLEGTNCAIRPEGIGLALVPGMAVDNDGVHGLSRAAGRTQLHAGLNPITLQWFNRAGSFSLNLEYQGAGLPRQAIPSAALSRIEPGPAAAETNFVPGLDYRCYENNWLHLADFSQYLPVSAGHATNFDLGVRTRDDGVALQFTGFLSIPRDGLYNFYLASDDGSRFFIGDPSLNLRVLTNVADTGSIGGLPSIASFAGRTNYSWVNLEGTVRFVGFRTDGQEMDLQVGNDTIRVEVFQGRQAMPNFPPDAKVKVSGIFENLVASDGSKRPGMMLVSSWKSVHSLSPPEPTPADASSGPRFGEPYQEDQAASARTNPVITQMSAVKALPLTEAERQLPVSVRGVITAILPSFIGGVVVQDATKGIFVSTGNLNPAPPLHRGDLCQVEGVTGPGMFAPIIVANRLTVLGQGQMPRPVHPRRLQLLNGSLDTQYVEVEGVVTSLDGQQLTLLTESGSMALFLSDFQADDLAPCRNALVRIRGCAMALFLTQTHELDPRVLRLIGASVDILQPAPKDLFDAPQKSLGELLLYDPQAAPFRRLRVRGQVIYRDATRCFLTDGTNGICVISRASPDLVPGDIVAAVGFLDPEGPAPQLSEAAMLKIGHAALPAAVRLDSTNLLSPQFAGRLVTLQATLVDQWRDGPEDILSLQAGFRTFRAQVDFHNKFVTWPAAGSLLELTGAYAPQGNRGADGGFAGFELLVHSPTDVRVLATPSWWTLKRVFILAGILAALLAAVVIWNEALQRQVRERGRRLEIESRNRQRAEIQHAAEADRARIARDLHDDLGSGLTEVSLLASSGLNDCSAAEKNQDRFRVIAEKARFLVSGLDVIVWAIDPKMDSLQSFADYLEIYAKELLSAANITCRLRIPIEFEYASLTGTARHGLLLAVKEALNNVIRHAAASEVELKITQSGGQLEITITDDGAGFDLQAPAAGFGLQNLRSRMAALHGACEIRSAPGKGSSVKLTLPLSGANTPAAPAMTPASN
jgi:signal transduction histidine kinase